MVKIRDHCFPRKWNFEPSQGICPFPWNFRGIGISWWQGDK